MNRFKIKKNLFLLFLEKLGLCESCHIRKATKSHTCPFDKASNDPPYILCTCCPKCEENCAWET